MTSPTVLATSKDGDVAKFDILLAATDDAFAGHFPDLPVLPGVVQIDWAIGLAVAHGMVRMEPAARDFQVKFRALIRPGVPLALTLRVERAKGWLFFDYRSGAATMSSGRIAIEATAS